MEDQRKVIEELVRGREFANQLRKVIREGEECESATPFAQHLAKNVLTSFSNTLLFLHKYPSTTNYRSQDQVSHQMQQVRDSSFFASPTKSEDSDESCKSSISKDRRGCYKRRKIAETWEKVSQIPTSDGYQWRKYGQKEILNSKYSRNYYRCTHKFDQKCQATKQVQRIQEEPPLYRTTYYGHHNCKNMLIHPEIILDPSSPSETSIFVSFNNTFPTPAEQDCPFLSSSFLSPSASNKCKEEVPSLSLEDYILSSPEPTIDNSSRHLTTASSILESSNHRDMMSSVIFYDSAELDMDDFFLPFV